jgi:hypothetical protein
MYDGKSFPLMVKSSDTILDVKKKIQDKEGIPVHEQLLFFDGKLIEDRQTIANYSIQAKSTIEMTLRSPRIYLMLRGLAD